MNGRAAIAIAIATAIANELAAEFAAESEAEGRTAARVEDLGNSCNLNSVLQCLTYTPPLADFCLRLQHCSLCDSTASGAEQRNRDCPFCILEKRIVRSRSVDLALDMPAKMQSCLRIFAEHFRCGCEKDLKAYLVGRLRPLHSKNFCYLQALCAKQARKLWIADAKQTFISQIPESLKEELVKHLQTFSQGK